MPRLILAPLVAVLAALLYARYRPSAAPPRSAAQMTAIDLEKQHQVGEAGTSSSSSAAMVGGEHSVRMHQVVLFGGASSPFPSGLSRGALSALLDRPQTRSLREPGDREGRALLWPTRGSASCASSFFHALLVLRQLALTAW